MKHRWSRRSLHPPALNTGMTISHHSTQAREAARHSDGTFGEQHLPEPDGLSDSPVSGVDGQVASVTGSDGVELRRHVRPDGTIEYRTADERILHNPDGPAVVFANGTKVWYRHGDRHRDGDLPSTEYADGPVEYRKHDKLHRADGPAYIVPGQVRAWYQEGRRHRLDGPAVDHLDTGETSWWVHGTRLTDDEVGHVKQRIRQYVAACFDWGGEPPGMEVTFAGLRDR